MNRSTNKMGKTSRNMQRKTIRTIMPRKTKEKKGTGEKRHTNYRKGNKEHAKKDKKDKNAKNDKNKKKGKDAQNAKSEE